MTTSIRETDVAVVGGGLAGLTAAALLARQGLRVTVFERSAAPGGRARTEARDGFLFNLGPHALYRHGAGARILHELGIPYRGATPPTSGGWMVEGRRCWTLPIGFMSLLTTGALTWRGKIEFARLLAALPNLDPHQWEDRPLDAWLAGIRDPAARGLVAMLARVATYTNAPSDQSAGAAIEQLQLAAAGNVLYLDGGWRTLVDGLRAAATLAGARIETATRVVRLEVAPRAAGESGDPGDCIRAVGLADGTAVPVRAAVMAAGPEDVQALIGADASRRLFGAAGAPVPVKMACLTVALRRLPNPRVKVAFGIDQPLYYSVHSAAARLAPAGGALIHLGWYGEPADSRDANAVRGQMEDWLDRFQPGWRTAVAGVRYLPSLTVTHGMARASTGGLKGRPPAKVPGVEGLYVAGDWVGATGQLSDASFASAREAALAILPAAARWRHRTPAPELAREMVG